MLVSDQQVEICEVGNIRQSQSSDNHRSVSGVCGFEFSEVVRTQIDFSTGTSPLNHDEGESFLQNLSRAMKVTYLLHSPYFT